MITIKTSPTFLSFNLSSLNRFLVGVSNAKQFFSCVFWPESQKLRSFEVRCLGRNIYMNDKFKQIHDKVRGDQFTLFCFFARDNYVVKSKLRYNLKFRETRMEINRALEVERRSMY